MIKFLENLFKSKKNAFKDKANFKELVSNQDIKELFKSFNSYSDNAELRFVGGCVRKLISGETVDDIDLSTNLKPENVIEVLKKNNINFYETGIEHGTITAVINKRSFEITTLRKDIRTDGRHAQVEYTDNWLEDASRRDFTINSIYSDLDGNLFDPFNGRKDLNDGLIKFIGDPAQRIKEDYLRILRYIRFFLGYSKNQHNKNTVKIIKQNLIGLNQVSKNRQLQELKKIILVENFHKINSDKTSKELFLLIFPELKNINRINKLDNLGKEILKDKDFEFILSLLLIDKSEDCDYFIYKYNLSNKEKDKINFLNLIFSEDLNKDYFTKENLTKILFKNGKENLIDILDFKILTTKKNKNNLIDLKKYFIEFKIPVIPIRAKDLIKQFNLKEGKLLGSILKEIEEQWLNNNFKISNNEIEDIVKSKRI
jgi:poly(A) polymerase